VIIGFIVEWRRLCVFVGDFGCEGGVLRGVFYDGIAVKLLNKLEYQSNSIYSIFNSEYSSQIQLGLSFINNACHHPYNIRWSAKGRIQQYIVELYKLDEDNFI
jgi:hypothetical protein